ncbi:unnamed protein product [Phytophthora lilii]|uniref:Unnamed protein product n=1 Tax=Phytophthora lilii TaxID=2077276 RepID=A0A9W6TDA2_9STRA|nr:unnamed protein product [Phytophthora lilii]
MEELTEEPTTESPVEEPAAVEPAAEEPAAEEPAAEEPTVEESPVKDSPRKDLHEHEFEIWCLIVGMIGTAFPVIVKCSDRVWELQKTIKKEAVEIFGDYNAAQLRLYLAMKDNGEWLSPTEVNDIENGDAEPAKALIAKGHLASMSKLARIFTHPGDNAVHILVPAPVKTPTIEVEADITGKRKRSEQPSGDAQPLEVSTEEINLLFNVLGQKTQSEQNMIATPGLNEFWKGYGGFPSSYFVRREELVLWKLVVRTLSKRDKRVVIVGSSGVGKSCFIILLSFFLAIVEHRRVLVVRRLTEFSEANAVVYLDGKTRTCTRKANLTAAKVTSLPDKKEFQGALILVDGYSPKEVDRRFGVLPFQVLATSVEEDHNFDKSTCHVLLPAWRYDSLHLYAEAVLDEWKSLTGFSHEKQADSCKLTKEQYFYSGGSLRDFCRLRGDIKNGMDIIFGTFTTVPTVDLRLQHNGTTGTNQWDHVRRLYIEDQNDEEHYRLVCHWRVCLDSGYALNRLGRFLGTEKLLEHHEFAQMTSSGFWDLAYKQCFYAALDQSTKETLTMMNVIVNSDLSYSNQRYDRIEICDRLVRCDDMLEEDWYERLSKLSPGLFWRPDCVSFPFVDAVVVCEAVLRGSTLKETIVACISTSVDDKVTFKPWNWKKLNQALDGNKYIAKSIPRLFVVVGPEARTCKMTTLTNAPASDEFMVCCYDPLKYMQRPRHASPRLLHSSFNAEL